jgi:sugar lactone lactonase YvrE
MKHRVTRCLAPAILLHLSTVLCLAQQASPAPAPPEDATRKEIAITEALLPKLADRAPALYVLATDYAASGNASKALLLLKECIDLDEGFDPSEDAVFRPLQKDPTFQALVKRAAQRYPAVHRAQPAFTVEEKDLIPEGLAADRAGRVFFMSSLNRRKIVQVRNGAVSDFVAADQYDLPPVLGLKVDPQDGGLWANTGAGSGGQSELVHFDASGKLLGRSRPSTPGKHLFNDLVLRGEHEVFLTDSLANAAFRFDRKTNTFTTLRLARAVYYPNGIALSGDGNLLFVADAFGVLRYDLRDGSSSEVEPGLHTTLAGMDGMYWHGGWLIAVQNGIGLPRIARFQLSTDGSRVTKSEILEYRSEFVELPTTGALVNGRFYFICNSQIDNLRDDKLVDPAKLRAIRVGVVKLD